MKSPTIKWLAGASLAVGMVGNALAGVVQMQNGSQVSTVEYRGDNYLRMSSEGQEGYMLQRSDKLYMVTNGMVIDAGATMKMFSGMVPDSGPQASAIKSMQKTDRHETIAGIRGRVWMVTYTDHKGREKTDEVVLSGDKRVIELRDAMMGFSKTMLKAAGKDANQVDAVFSALKEKDKGYLRFGNEMKVVSISGETVSKNRFDLPAEPTTMPNMGNIFSGSASAEAGASADGAEASAGGGFSLGKLFGQKAERQQDRVEERTDAEVDQQTDNVVDKALDKAFNKLFGN